MYNPFEQINRAFASHYRVNLRIVGLDGSIMLTLSDQTGIVAKHLIDPAQRNDPQQLQGFIDSVRAGLAAHHEQQDDLVLHLVGRPPLPTAAVQPRPSTR